MSLGASQVGSLRDSNRGNDPFFSQLMNGQYSQPGLRDTISSPIQGFIPSSRDAARNFQYSILQPSQWRSSLGLQNEAQTDWRYGSGDYSTPGSVRGRTGYSGFELDNPYSLLDEVSPYTTGNSSFGGIEKTFEYSHGDEGSNTIARSGKLGGMASDQSGVSTAQSQYSFSDPYSYSDSGNTEFGDYGSGSWSDTGNVNATLVPGGNYTFNNQISRSQQGSGQSTMTESQSGEGNSLMQAMNNVKSTGELGGRVAQLGITAAGKLAGMGVSAALQAANLAMLSNPATALIGLATLPISHFGGKAVGRLLAESEKHKYTNTKSTAESDLSSLTNLGLQGEGSLDFNKYLTGQASVATPSASGYGNTASDVYTGLGQRANMRLGPNASGSVNLLGDVGGVSDTLLSEHELEKKSKGNWSSNKSYNAMAGSEQSQQSNLLGQATVLNKDQMLRQNVPQDWVSQNIDPQITDNFDTYRKRYPGLYGNYNSVDDYITREYYKQNPQAAASFGLNSDISTISNAVARSPLTGMPSGDLDYRNENRQGVDIQGNIALSGSGGVDVANGASINTTQTTRPQAGAFGTTLGYNTSSALEAQLNSELAASLNGLGAQADAVNELKFNYNNTEYGATLKLQAQRFINDLETQLPMSRESQAFIESLRNNPELTALFEQGLPPETIVRASLDYDKTNKTFSNRLEWDQNQNYQAAQVYDPTPDQPNSGDEVGLANIFGDVRQLDAGKLYDIGYKDVLGYDTNYKLPTPITTQSNEYLQDQYNWNKELANNMYYFTPGQNEAYNALANEFINRRYNLQDNFDTSLTDQYLSQIGQDGFDLGNYSLEDFQNLQNLLQQERQVDLNPQEAQNFMEQSYYLPDQQVLNPNFNYYIAGKGYYQDPRLNDVTKTDLLEKYFDYSRWQPGQSVQDEWAHYVGMAPGSPGSGNRRIDPITGGYLTDAREMTPEEFAQVQVENLPNDYTWQSQIYDPLIQKGLTGYRLTSSWQPVYGDIQTGWTPSDNYETKTFSDVPTKYYGGGYSGTPIYYSNPFGFGPSYFSGYSNSYATDPFYMNYNAYKAALADAQSRYLAGATNIPV